MYSSQVSVLEKRYTDEVPMTGNRISRDFTHFVSALQGAGITFTQDLSIVDSEMCLLSVAKCRTIIESDLDDVWLFYMISILLCMVYVKLHPKYSCPCVESTVPVGSYLCVVSYG